MFKVASDTAVPGFRVGLPDEPPGFSIDENGSMHRPLLAAPGAAAFGFDPYGNVLQTMAPTAVRPAGMFYKANSGLFPTPYQAYVPVSGDTPFQDPLRQAVDRANAPISGGTPSQDPLRQAVDRAADLPTGPTHPPATTLTPSQIGGLIGGFIGGTLVLLRHKWRHLRRAFLRAQQGHRGARRMIATIRRRRMVAIEFGT
jgi:hypothetical protein